MSILKLGRNAFMKQFKLKCLPVRQSTVISSSSLRILHRNYAVIPPRYPPMQYKRPTSLNNQYTRFSNNERGSFYMSKRFWLFIGTGTVIYGGYYVTHLERVPISGRIRFMNVSPKLEEAMAIQAYNEVMHEFRNRILPANHPYTRFVRRIAQRIIQVSGMEDMKWEVHVVNSREKNAFVLPGGKIFVFTGILPIVQNEDGMAAVLGHEISHQLARHSAEKLSFVKILLAIQLTLSLLGIEPSFLFNQYTYNFIMMKPFSRKCEIEADDIGIQLMAQACFDPKEAIEVWKRMELYNATDIPQFASTHPSHENRIKYLTKKVNRIIMTTITTTTAAV
ncbi:peptidase family M48-domain-containing protein [Cokeromyces recurvatus]|uniref:peptidase family M48-domain-containing protein n=1 Tax=Cokeromyces recurvatus TaxID=90255 RepID=UPI002220DC66|nr:peptidase family M48-domain-containing protein [Cokeromyces recurvatus]KAI7900266.1 peptidase family M48-domain-containing protein [Cokeromyces recurvatus]